MSKLFLNIPSQLTSNANRHIASNAVNTRINRRKNEYIADMEDSQVVTLAYHANDPEIILFPRGQKKYFLHVVLHNFFGDKSFWKVLWKNMF